MVFEQDEQSTNSQDPPLGSPVLEAVLENERNRRYLGQRLDAANDRVDTDLLGDIVRHGPVLEALLQEPLDRGEIEERLDVSRATSHRFTQWLDEQGFVDKVDGRFQLTGRGEVVAEEILRFEANVRTAHRLAPLLDVICEDHQEFVVEPFMDATVTVAEPEDPYRPVERFISLVHKSETFREFNTTHMAPLVFGGFHQQVFGATDTEIIYLPHIVKKLFETYPERAGRPSKMGIWPSERATNCHTGSLYLMIGSGSGGTTKRRGSCKCSLILTRQSHESGPNGCMYRSEMIQNRSKGGPTHHTNRTN